MSAHVVGIAGSLNRPSKTRALVDLVTARVAARLAIPAATYDLADLQPALGAAATLDDLTPQPRAIVNTLLAAEVLVIGTPVYKGSYTGLFKHLFDLFDPAALAGKPVLLTATGGGEKHALVIEHQPFLLRRCSIPVPFEADGPDIESNDGHGNLLFKYSNLKEIHRIRAVMRSGEYRP